MTNELSLFGGTGFIGKNFQKLWADLRGDGAGLYVRDRWMRRPYPGVNTDTLWMISTVHNYNVFDDATLDVKTNLVALTEGLESHRRNGFTGVFNFVSSWFVYGDHGTQDVTENLSCYPQGFYSITKRAAEQLVMSYCETFNMKYRILRYCNTLGPGDTPTAKKNALQFLINKMKNQEDIDIYNDGRFYRNYMHVEDVCRATMAVMDRGKVNTIYNIGHPEHDLFINHILYVRDRMGYSGKINYIPPKDFHKQVQTTSFRMDTNRLQLDTAFRPHYSLHRMLDEIT